MTLLKPPRSVGADDAWVAAGTGAGSEAGVEVPAGSPSCDAAAPEGRRRRLLLGAPDVLSGFAAETGGVGAGRGPARPQPAPPRPPPAPPPPDGGPPPPRPAPPP